MRYSLIVRRRHTSCIAVATHSSSSDNEMMPIVPSMDVHSKVSCSSDLVSVATSVMLWTGSAKAVNVPSN